jgi:signal transduction histidine kinase
MNPYTESSLLSASERLRRHEEEIVRDWIRRARQLVHAARAQNDARLRDSLSEYLDGLAATLEQPSSEQRARNLAISRDHARPLVGDERERLNEAFDAAMGQAGAAFMQAQLLRTQSDIRALVDQRTRLTEFVATLTHDLRQPLAAAKLALQRIEVDPALPQPLGTLAKKAMGNIDRVDRMIQDLLDATRIHAGGRLPIQVEPLELVELLREVVEELMAVHGDRFVLNARGPIRGTWSRCGIRRVVENLASNAVKYGDADRPIAISAGARGENVTISVHNEGPPLSAEEQAQMFEPFQRSAAAERSGKRGWGLGLTLVRGVAAAHGGIVEVRPGTKGGVTFAVSLPREPRPRF